MNDQIQRLASPVAREREIALDEMYDIFYYGHPTAEEAKRGLEALQGLLDRETDDGVLDCAFRAACGAAATGYASFARWDSLAVNVAQWAHRGRIEDVLTVLGGSGDLSKRTVIERFLQHSEVAVRDGAKEALETLLLRDEALRRRRSETDHE